MSKASNSNSTIQSARGDGRRAGKSHDLRRVRRARLADKRSWLEG